MRADLTAGWAIVLLAAIAGCGGGKADDHGGGASASAPASVPTPAVTTAPPPSGSDAATRRQVLLVANAYFDAVGRLDYARACKLLTAHERQQTALGARDCPSGFRKAVKTYARVIAHGRKVTRRATPRRYHVTDVKFGGSSATVTVAFANPAIRGTTLHQAYTLLKEGGTWKVGPAQAPY